MGDKSLEEGIDDLVDQLMGKRESKVPLSLFVGEQVKGMEIRLRTYDHLVGEILATLKVNKDKGVFVEENKDLLFKMVENWEKQYAIAKGKK